MNFASLKGPFKGVKIQTTEKEQIFALHIPPKNSYP